MPVTPPGYNHEQADKAYNEIIKLLREKYDVLDDEDFDFVSKFWKASRDEVLTELKDAIHKVFRQDCYETY